MMRTTLINKLTFIFFCVFSLSAFPVYVAAEESEAQKQMEAATPGVKTPKLPDPSKMPGHELDRQKISDGLRQGPKCKSNDLMKIEKFDQKIDYHQAQVEKYNEKIKRASQNEDFEKVSRYKDKILEYAELNDSKEYERMKPIYERCDIWMDRVVTGIQFKIHGHKRDY